MENVNNQPKYSLEPLPGDPWEVRRSKQMIRALSHERSKGGMTTEELARRCSRFLGEEGAVKTSTLNGIFAGKRKSLSVAEVEMFAAALNVPVDRILYPSGEMIEVRPGKFRSSADALVDAMSTTLPSVPPIRAVGRAGGALRIVHDAAELEGTVVGLIGGYRLGRLLAELAGLRLAQLGYTSRSLATSLARYRKTWTEDPPTVSEGVMAVLELDLGPMLSADNPDFDSAMAALLQLEPLFRGYQVGDYPLGGSSPDDTVPFTDGEGRVIDVPLG